MSISFPTEAWSRAFHDAINKNAAYEQAGKEWTFGSVAMIVRSAPEKGVAQDVGMLLDVHQGKCKTSEYLEGEFDEDLASFVIVGSYDEWVEVIRGELDPIMGMMGGRLELSKGHLPTMIRFVEASRELVRSASLIDTHFAHEDV